MSLIDHPSAVAITGMACRFPGAPTVQQFWENLRGGVESITFFTDEELADARIPQAVLDQADYVRAKPLVTGIEQFDAAFFGLTPREASLMDPQHRLFLECAWEALESAGHDADRFRGRIGVYGGANLSSYLLFNLLNNPDAMFSLGGVGGRTGIDKDFLTTQVSYRLNLRGPSFAVQTACSTSLVALHVACQQLLDGDCDMALAGGVGINLPHKAGYLYQEGSIYSPDGHCRAFDADSEGTLLGDGAGIVVLRRLADALADGDPIHAVVRGSAINNDGSTKVGFSAPSVDSQAEVITEAMALARVAPDSVSYVEAHGTGTKLGDPIEVAALTHAFRAGTERNGFCGLGSVKTNFGHLDAAAGVAGLIKTVLALENRQIPASLHFQKPNPQIDFANSPFFVNAELRDWPDGPAPRRAGVSSFGVGGTNAHVVLEEAPEREPSGPSRPWQVLPLSAKTPTALDAATANLAKFLAEHPEAPLADFAFTLQSGRRAFPHRRIVVCADSAGATEAIAALQALDPVRTATSAAGTHARAVAFLFPGQGAQHVNMARDVYEGEPVFRQELDRCAEILQPHLDLELRTVLYPAAGGEEEAGKLLEQTRLTQPALFAVEYALARLWMSWGITPQALIGHSVGEYVAACLAGVFSLEDALALVATRGRLIQGLPAGAMLAVPLPEEEVAPRMKDGGPGLSLAAVNGPGFCVVSGPEEPVEALRKILDSEGVECTRLHTSHAFHSEMMDPILGPFAERVGRVRLSAPKIPYLSNVTGAWITEAEATDPGYWTRHIRQTVRFADGLAALLEDPDRVLLEVGPGQSLTTLARQMPSGAGARAADRVAIPSLRRPKDDGPDLPRVLHALGRLWAAGVRVDWSAFAAGERRQRLALPTYPFERERFWVDPVLGNMALSSAAAEGSGAAATHGPGLVKQDIDRWFYVPAWKQADRLAAPLPREEDAPGSWLLFLPEDDGLGHRLAERLRERGDTVLTATPGDAFTAGEDGTFTLRPAERKDYDALFKEIRSRKVFPRGVPDRAVHLWNLVQGDGSAAVPFYSLLYLVQVLSEEAAGEEVRLGVVSSGLQAVTGDEEIEPEKALLLGFCRVVPQENPKLGIQSLDVAVPTPGSHAERELVDRLLAELEGEAPHKLADRVVAFRGRHRWVQHHEPAAIDGRFSQAARLRQGGVYLLTGGLDPTTLAFARHLTGSGAGPGGKLAITVPPGFPERERWDGLTASPAGGHDPVRRTVQTVREIEEHGAEVLLIPVDLAGGGNPAAEEAVNRTLERFGTLHGVLHVEMFPGAGLIQLKTPELADPVLRPRVTATRALADALAAKVNGAGLDFFALFGSTIGITGGLGQIDFSAANNYLDAFAHQQRASGGLPALSIDWGAFQWEEWQQMLGGGGVGLQGGMQLEMQKSIEAFGIDMPESLEAFRRVLAAGVPQVVVSTGDLDLVLRQHDVITAQLLGQQPGAGSGQHHARPMLSSQYIAPANEVETGIANIWQDLLGIAPIGVQDNFFELAGNSLTAIQIVTRVRKAFDVDVSMSAIFEAPTVGGLARIVQAGQLGDEALAEVDGILDEIENLSEEELERLLAEEMESGDAAHGG